MKASLRALLSEAIDYAGLFPPARLDLDTAFGNYERYRAGPHAWMLGRFLCPIGLLQDADRLASACTRTQPFRASLVLEPAETVETSRSALERQMRVLLDRPRSDDAPLRIEAFEIRLPADLTRSNCHAFLRQVEQVFASADLSLLCEVYEIAPDECASGIIAELAPNRLRDKGAAADRCITLKLRCGGPDPSAVPAPAHVARIIAACRDANLPLKFTAGLHRPFRHIDPAMQRPLHGFINLFVAGVLAWSLQLDEPDIQAIVEEQDARQFRFEADLLAWNEAEAMLDEIEFARQHRVVSFGSCSFTEPLDELRRCGLLEE